MKGTLRIEVQFEESEALDLAFLEELLDKAREYGKVLLATYDIEGGVVDLLKRKER